MDVLQTHRLVIRPPRSQFRVKQCTSPRVLLPVKNFRPATPLRGNPIVARAPSHAPCRHVWPPSVMRVATPRGSRIPGIPDETTLNYYISCLYQSRAETVGYCEPPSPGMMNCNCHVTSIQIKYYHPPATARWTPHPPIPGPG